MLAGILIAIAFAIYQIYQTLIDEEKEEKQQKRYINHRKSLSNDESKPISLNQKYQERLKKQQEERQKALLEAQKEIMIEPHLIEKEPSEQEEQKQTEQQLQSSLEEYHTRNMNKEEVGRYYERLVGYHYEKNGWKILYNGALKGLKDKGIDLVGTRGNEKIIIQAKGWRHTSIIDSDIIYRLAGATKAHNINHNENHIGILATFDKVLLKLVK